MFKRKRKGSDKLYLSPTDSFELRQRRIEDLQRKQEYELARRRSAETKTSRFNSKASSALRLLANPVRGLYPSPVNKSSAGLSSRRRGAGRPRGTYDRRYAAYGGVYGYRKILNARLREQRMQALRNATINPQQQQILANVEARERAQRENPENRVIPDTSGQVDMDSIMDEINRASNAFP